MASDASNDSRNDQLPNSMNTISHCDDQVTSVKHVNETLLDVDDDTTASKQVGGLSSCSYVASATLANVFDTMETCMRFEQNETQNHRDSASHPRLPSLRFQGMRALTASQTNSLRLHKKLRILREARQKK